MTDRPSEQEELLKTLQGIGSQIVKERMAASGSETYDPSTLGDLLTEMAFGPEPSEATSVER